MVHDVHGWLVGSLACFFDFLCDFLFIPLSMALCLGLYKIPKYSPNFQSDVLVIIALSEILLLENAFKLF